MAVKERIVESIREGRKMLAILLDPEKTPLSSVSTLCRTFNDARPDLILVGGSTGSSIEALVVALKQQTTLPVVLFPGNPEQFTPKADALLFLSLVSGRNPELLIGAQSRVAKQVKASGIETLPMGYILVDGGRVSAVEKASGTAPLSQTDEIVSTALAAELLGMQSVYLEAGSGARKPVEEATIQAVREAISLPLFVGGGITTVAEMQTAFRAGADIVVIGNHFERHPEEIPAFCAAK